MANGITPTSPTQNSFSALSSPFHQRKPNLLNCGWLRLAGSESRDLEQRLGRPVITSANVADIHFFSRKQFTGQENVDAKARQVMTKLYALFELIDTLGIDCQNAIAIENNDYEDAIMIESAVRSGLDCIVTRNPEHFKVSPIPVYSPSEFAQKLNEPSS